MTVALLCSGQGTQHREMFRLTADLPAAAGIFSAAREALGSDPRTFVLTASEASLHANRTAQILCVTQALAAATMIAGALARRTIVAGYSVGEVAAWGIAGLLSLQATIDLARIRAEIMDGASRTDDGLGFLRGLPRERVAALGSQHGVEIAIVNPGDAFIVGGSRPSLLAFVEAALAAGATRAGLLPVSVASHTSQLEEAVAPFRDAIDAHEPKRPEQKQDPVERDRRLGSPRHCKRSGQAGPPAQCHGTVGHLPRCRRRAGRQLVPRAGPRSCSRRDGSVGLPDQSGTQHRGFPKRRWRMCLAC